MKATRKGGLGKDKSVSLGKIRPGRASKEGDTTVKKNRLLTLNDLFRTKQIPYDEWFDPNYNWLSTDKEDGLDYEGPVEEKT